MKAITQFTFLALTLTLSGLTGAEVYKYIDDNGNVAYGDKPVDGAEKIKIRRAVRPSQQYGEPDGEGADSYEEPASSNGGEGSDGELDETQVNYRSLEILTPSQGKVIDDRSGTVQVIFLPTPSLGNSDELVISVNGKDVNQGREANLSLQQMPRGTHTVTGKIVDKNGTTKISATTVTFTVGKK